MSGPSEPETKAGRLHARQLYLFAVRCRQLAEQVDNGLIDFISAVDTAYSAAEWSGMIDLHGNDAVQEIMAAAFMRARRRAA
jgi:hypothetical protein